MQDFFKTTLKVITAFTLITGITTTASAGTTYHVYQKGNSSTCDISTKGPSDYNRGSKYHLVASDSSRGDAKKKGTKAGCSSF